MDGWVNPLLARLVPRYMPWPMSSPHGWARVRTLPLSTVVYTPKKEDTCLGTRETGVCTAPFTTYATTTYLILYIYSNNTCYLVYFIPGILLYRKYNSTQQTLTTSCLFCFFGVLLLPSSRLVTSCRPAGCCVCRITTRRYIVLEWCRGGVAVVRPYYEYDDMNTYGYYSSRPNTLV